MVFLNDINELMAFTEQPRAHRNLVFYSEGPEYWLHFRGIIHELIHRFRYPVAYLTSKRSDPGLEVRSHLLKSYFIDPGSARTNLFNNLDADVMVMTMPDLDSFHIRRSATCHHYAYLFHSPVSTHMVYKENAFDHYDSIFCVGPHQEHEIRARESLIGAPPKNLVQHGYSRLDEIVAAAKPISPDVDSNPIHVLIAPSWGPHGIFETIGCEVVEILLSAGFVITARVHPQTLRLSSHKINELDKKFSRNDCFNLETDLSKKASIESSALMISDWSGAALEYSLGLKKPVVFLDTPRKVNNQNYQQLNIEPMEVTVRNRLGRIVAIDELGSLPATIHDLIFNAEEVRKNAGHVLDKTVYNLGTSDTVAAKELIEIASGFVSSPNAVGMTMDEKLHQTLEGMLEAILKDTDQELPRAIVVFLKELFVRQESISPDQVRKLDALCRRIDVFKRLRISYDEWFESEIGEEKAPRDAYLILSYVLSKAAPDLPDKEFGSSLKFLNSAGNALNLYIAKGGINGAPLVESLIARTTDEVLGEL